MSVDGRVVAAPGPTAVEEAPFAEPAPTGCRVQGREAVPEACSVGGRELELEPVLALAPQLVLALPLGAGRSGLLVLGRPLALVLVDCPPAPSVVIRGSSAAA